MRRHGKIQGPLSGNSLHPEADFVGLAIPAFSSRERRQAKKLLLVEGVE
jgi:hypothetical protein